MIILVTGVPGSGKTLFTINYVKAWAERENRQVFQNGIEILDPAALPWHPLEDANLWYKCEPKSIIVVDECQRFWRPRSSGTAVPVSIKEMETHRHLGVDLVLITQNPGLVDANIRKLVGRHFHVVRSFGRDRATVREWESCKELSKSTIKEAVPHYFKYPKESYGWYKSAEVHTHKKRVPMRVYVMYAIPVFLVICFGAAYVVVHKASRVGVEGVAKAAGTDVGGGGVRGGKVEHLSRVEWLKIREPRIAGLVHTAPVYDELTKPTRVALPVACVRGERERGRCQCYSQDATVMDVGTALCMDIVARGFFLDFAAEKKNDAGAPKQGAAAVVGGAGPAVNPQTVAALGGAK